MSSTDTECYKKTTETNLLIDKMFKGVNYTGGEITQAEFLEKFQIMGFKLMEQFEVCGVNEFLIVLDGASSDLPRTMSALSSLGTQIVLGWENGDTAIYYSVKDLTDKWGTEDYEGLGKGLGLLVSQILKFEAPAAVIEVKPTGV